jgi:hypothetical protein
MAMKKSISLAAILAACAAASGCTQFSQAIGAEKVAPDEFRVVTRAPLSVPPDFGLRPPRPGDARPAELRSDQTRAAVFGQDRGANASPGEKLLVARAGAEAVDPNIRSQIDFEGAAIVRKPEGFANRVTGAAEPDEAQKLAEAESARRATGGNDVVIRKAPDRMKLPGL